MLEGYSPIVQSLMGTCLTWGLTAAGASLVFIMQGGKEQRRTLDVSLGFSAGVMLAASYWSLLAPAIEMADISGMYGSFTFIPISFGFVIGALFVYMADLLLPLMSVSPLVLMGDDDKTDHSRASWSLRSKQDSISDAEEGEFIENDVFLDTSRTRKRAGQETMHKGGYWSGSTSSVVSQRQNQSSPPVSWRRILLLIIAITVHNIPEGLAVGVGFGAIGTSPSATLERARNLAIGIGLQNFPEGLAVSLPLQAAGLDVWKSFWYGQLSGMVEPLAGLLGAAAVVLAQPLLPYALSFAAGAMIFVVVDDIIPEAFSSGNGRLSSYGVILGFVVMMSLDIGLG